MKSQTRLLVIGSTLIALLLLTTATLGGMLLAPHFNPTARAADNGPDVAAALEQSLVELYQNNLPSIVKIRVTQKADMPGNGALKQFKFFGPFDFGLPNQSPQPQMPDNQYLHGQGSGFVWDKQGHIVTNDHVVENATSVEVEFADGTTAEAEVLGTDPNADLAVIRVDLPAGKLHPASLGNSDDLQVGQLAVAIGNPFGQEFTMTSGIISAVGRIIQSGTSPFSIPEVIQTDAAINPGNSGGPLFNRQGQVVGINTQIISRSGGSAGIGFAIPINTAKQVVPTLIKGQDYEYAWLGITGMTLSHEVASFMKLPEGTKGALVINVSQDSPADKAKLQGSDKTLKSEGTEYRLGGDVITAINDQPIEDMNDLVAYLIEETRPGDTATLTVIHPDGQEEAVQVELTARPKPEELSKKAG